MLPSRFMQPKFVGKLAVGKRTKFEVENSENYLSTDNMFIVIARNSLELLLDKTPVDTDVFNASSEHLEKITTS